MAGGRAACVETLCLSYKIALSNNRLIWMAIPYLALNWKVKALLMLLVLASYHVDGCIWNAIKNYS